MKCRSDSQCSGGGKEHDWYQSQECKHVFPRKRYRFAEETSSGVGEGGHFFSICIDSLPFTSIWVHLLALSFSVFTIFSTNTFVCILPVCGVSVAICTSLVKLVLIH